MRQRQTTVEDWLSGSIPGDRRDLPNEGKKRKHLNSEISGHIEGLQDDEINSQSSAIGDL